mmetsp:Transcript_27649/g.64110  ORF Transcript_27649/g.64110 Transcript_27649/m.64110 type:complete len:235 (-) Transcript_27649:862-1566(-)
MVSVSCCGWMVVVDVFVVVFGSRRLLLHHHPHPEHPPLRVRRRVRRRVRSRYRLPCNSDDGFFVTKMIGCCDECLVLDTWPCGRPAARPYRHRRLDCGRQWALDKGDSGWWPLSLLWMMMLLLLVVVVVWNQQQQQQQQVLRLLHCCAGRCRRRPLSFLSYHCRRLVAVRLVLDHQHPPPPLPSSFVPFSGPAPLEIRVLLRLLLPTRHLPFGPSWTTLSVARLCVAAVRVAIV